MFYRPIFIAGLMAVGTPATAETVPAGTLPTTCAFSDVANPETLDGAACRLADLLEDTFVFPAQGKAYAEMLRRRVKEGAYDNLSQADGAQAMTSDLQALAADGHLRVRVDESRTSTGGAQQKREYPPVLQKAGWIAPGIAFIRINAFLPDDQQTADVTRFMADHADAKAVIFDLRTHGGGGLAQMDVIFPWLFAEKTRLVTMAMRRSVEEDQGAPFEPNETLRMLEGTSQETMREHWALPNGDPRLHDAKVYLLTSERTNSAAEHFAFALKLTGRAKLVGKSTAGGNHFGGGVQLPGGLSAFVSFGRTFDPVTGRDWEGTGVAPDFECPPETALTKVLIELGLPELEAESLNALYMPDPERMKRRKL